MTRRDSSRSARASSSAASYPARTKPPSRRNAGNSSASARASSVAIAASGRRSAAMAVGDIARHVRQRRKARGKFRRGANPVADRGEIARPAAADDDARQRARQIGHGLERAAQIAAHGAVVDESRDRIEPVRDFVRIGQRRGEPLRQQARAGRRHRAVDGRQQRAAPLAGERANQFEIGARRLIDRRAWRRRPRAPAATAAAACRSACARHRSTARGRGGQLDAREARRTTPCVATPKNAASRRSAVAPSNTSRVSGVTAGSERR